MTGADLVGLGGVEGRSMLGLSGIFWQAFQVVSSLLPLSKTFATP